VAACASSAPSGPQITPVNATVKLGRVTEKTFLTRIDVANPNDSGYGVGVEPPVLAAVAAVGALAWDSRWI
jgi:hypothetical protein